VTCLMSIHILQQSTDRFSTFLLPLVVNVNDRNLGLPPNIVYGRPTVPVPPIYFSANERPHSLTRLRGYAVRYDSATSLRTPVTRVPCTVVMLPTRRTRRLPAGEQHRIETCVALDDIQFSIKNRNC